MTVKDFCDFIADKGIDLNTEMKMEYVDDDDDFVSKNINEVELRITRRGSFLVVCN